MIGPPSSSDDMDAAVGSTANRRHLPYPEGYLVPLRDDGELARSYVFAFTRWLKEAEVAEYLPAVSNFGGQAIAYRDKEVLRFRLNGEGINQLPDGVFGRGLISSIDWSDASSTDTVIELDRCRHENGHFVRLSGFVVILREGERSGNEVGLPAGSGNLGREGRATIWVDLDGMLRNHALQALYAIVSDLSIASGTIGLERVILDDRAWQWDRDLGRFLTPEETLERYQQERLRMLD